MKKRIVVFFSLFIFAFSCQNLAAQIKILSPVSGTWSNKQVLVLDNLQNGDYFYSINGSDPERSGFAYDGPVLLNMNGEVNLKVTFVGRNGKKETASVNYKVVENDAYSSNYGVFISSFYDSGMLSYSAGSYITIPSELEYSLGLPPDSFLPGQDISISSNSILTKSIPCVIWDKNSDLKWRFIINTYPHTAGIYSRRDVPFEITDWETITFTDNKLIYRIDSDYWDLPKKPVKIDRSQSHMISWQNLEYEQGNAVEFFVLPPKPQVLSKTAENGGITFYFEGDDSYSMSVFSEQNQQYQELFTEIGIDTFTGDKASGKLDVGIFSNSVYQGKMELSYNVDKRPPSKPEITADVQSFYSRKPVAVNIKGQEDSKTFVAVSKPLELSESDDFYDQNDQIFQNVEASDFTLIDGEVKSLVLPASPKGAVFYKICAYSVSGNNTSRISEYSVLIDQYNYYFDSVSASPVADGTKQNPFTTFEQCQNAINSSSSVCLKVRGQIVVPQGKNVLSSNVTIINDENASLVFEGESSIIAKNAGIELIDMRIQSKNRNGSSINPLFKLENSVLTVQNCEGNVDAGKNGTFIDSFNSAVVFDESIFSFTAMSYASFVSAVKSHLTVKKSTLSVVADTSVIFSCKDGDIKATENSFSVSGKAGRIAELFASDAQFMQNLFQAKITSGSKMEPVYADKKSTLTEKENQKNGF